MAENRTSEFLSLAASLPPSGAVPIPSPSEKPEKAQAYRKLREFHETAGGISRDIAETSALLQQLASLVRRHDSQDDNGTMNRLVVRIKQNIESLNGRLDMASRQSKSSLPHKQASQQTDNLVKGLHSEFAQTATGFKDILQERTDAMNRKDQQKQEVYGRDDDDGEVPAIPDLDLMSSPMFQENTGSMGLDLTSSLKESSTTNGSSPLPRPHGLHGDIGNGGGSSMRHRLNASSNYYNNESQAMTPYELQQMEEAQGLTQQLIPETDYFQSRADAMETVEANMVELGTIFNKLAVMVNEHADMVQRVEDNVEEANMNVNLSLATLTDTLMSLKTNKKLALRIGAIMTLFIIFFIIAVA